VNARVHLLAEAVRRSLSAEVEEAVPTYRSLLLFFDPLRVPRARLAARVERLLAALPARAEGRRGRLVHVPVSYGGELGPDLAFVAERNQLTESEVVSIHSSVDYRVYMLGFTPGFPYLGGMSPRIAAPRLDQPRPRIPAGTVGIAGEQTGIYPVESPGGWRLIGRTPLRLFDPGSRAPFLLSAGDRLRFRPVEGAEFQELARLVAQGAYSPEIEADGA
jgi:inhibitor of KinA